MKPYKKSLQPFTRTLRNNPTDAEYWLWFHLRKKQICNVQFYRQKILGGYIVDFYAPSVKLVVELDGSHHYQNTQQNDDKHRDAILKSMDLSVLRFNNLQVIFDVGSVINCITAKIEGRVSHEVRGEFIDLGLDLENFS